MVSFQRTAAGFYVVDVAATTLVGFLTDPNSVENTLSLADAWRRAGTFIIGEKPAIALDRYAAKVRGAIHDPRVRIAWFDTAGFPTPQWTVLTTPPGAQPCTLVDQTTFDFRQVRVTMDIGAAISQSDDALDFATNGGLVSLELVENHEVKLGGSLSLLLAGEHAGSFRASSTLKERDLHGAGEGASYFHVANRANYTELTRTSFRIVRAPDAGIPAELVLAALYEADHDRTFIRPTTPLLDSYLYLNQGRTVRLRPLSGTGHKTARWVFGEDKKYLSADAEARYCLMPRGHFEVVQPVDVKRLTTGKLLVGRSGSEYLHVALGHDVPTRAGGGDILEFDYQRAFVDGAPTDKNVPFTNKLVTAGVIVRQRPYVAQHEQAALHKPVDGKLTLAFNELPLAPTNPESTIAFAPFGGVSDAHPHAIDWDANVLGPARRAAFTVAPAVRAATVEVSTTPHGLLLETRGNAPFAISILAAPTGTEPLVKVELTGISTDLADAVMREKVFAVIPNEDRSACAAVKLKLSIAGWSFDGELAPSTGDEAGIVVFKFFDGLSLRELIERPDLWTYPRPVPSAVEGILRDWVKSADVGAAADATMFSDIVKLIDDPGWHGVLLVNFGVPLDAVPEDVKGIVKNLPWLRAHHLGLQLNQVGSDNNSLSQSKPALFGLISYDDPTSPLTQHPFDFKVRELKVRFANSHLADFRCRAVLRIEELLFDKAALEPPANDNVFSIEGRWESRIDDHGNAKDVYVFQNDQEHKFTFPAGAPVLDSLTVTRAQLTSTTTGGETSVRFSFTGGLKCKPIGDFDAIGIDSVEFHDLGLDMIPHPTLPKFSVHPAGIKLGLPKLRDGLLSSFPVRLRGLLFAGVREGLDLSSFGFWPLSIGSPSGPKLTFGFVFDLDLGLPGGFAPAGQSLTVQLVLGWTPGGMPSFGLGLPSSANGRLEFGLQGVLRLLAKHVVVESVAGAIAIRLVHCQLEVLGTAIPADDDEDDDHGLSAFIIVPKGLGSKVAWFAATNKELPVGTAFSLNYLGLGQRIKPAATGSCLDVVKDFETNLFDVSQAVKPERYDENTGWTIVTHLKSPALDGELQLVFSDPSLACLHLELLQSGPVPFKLDISYRKVGDDVGVFSIDTRLPIHRMEFGAVSVGLPNIGVDVFTNGDFRVDVGFPRGTDFSRSCEVQAFPFIGSGGFYIAKLSGATSDLLHDTAIKRVLQVGVAARVGLGKSIEMGPLRAGASITVFGTLEGALGYRDVPYSLTSPTDLRLFARMGLIAEIYGYVDFGIIKASVSIRLSAEVGISILVTDKHLADITLYVAASVEVGVEVVIASFKIFGHRIEIKISFHFHTDLQFQFQIVKHDAAHMLRAAVAPRRLEAIRVVAPGELPELPLWLVADATVTFGARQTPTCVVFASLPRSPSKDETETPPTTPSAFDVLAEVLLRWILEAPDDHASITADAMTALENELEPYETLAEIGLVADTISKLLDLNFRITVADRSGEGQALGVFFPLLPDIDVTAEFQGEKVWSNRDQAPQKLGPRQRWELTEWINSLLPEHRPRRPKPADNSGEQVSLPDLIYQDYFNALLKGVVREARDELKAGALSLRELLAALRKERLPRLALALSHFFLHGLRLPPPAFPEDTPLFVALQQQFPFFPAAVPANPTTDYVVRFKRGAAECDDTILSSDTTHGFAALRALETSTVAPPLTASAATLFEARPRAFAMPHRVTWNGLTAASALDLHMVPSELADYLSSEVAQGPSAPVMSFARHKLDWTSSDDDSGTPVTEWRAALRIDLVLEPVLDDKKTETGVYRLISGVKDEQRLALQKLLDTGGVSGASIELARATDSTLTSIDIANGYLTRVDLTHRPKPPPARAMRAMRGAGIPDEARPSDPAAFLQILSELFIVNSSGYLLVLPAPLANATVRFDASVIVTVAGANKIPLGTNALLVKPDTSTAGELTLIATDKNDRNDRFVPAIPPGCVSFTVQGTKPDAGLDVLYHLLDYGWAATPAIEALDQNASLPIGPEGRSWLYRTTVPLSRFAKHGAVPQSPYNAVGEKVTVQLGLRDLYGNRAPHMESVELQLLYTDALIPLQALPGTNISFTSASRQSLVATAKFDPTYLIPAKTAPSQREEALVRIETQYTRAYQQAMDPNVSIALSSRLGATTPMDKALVQAYLAKALANLRTGTAFSSSPLATTVTPTDAIAPIDLDLAYERPAALLPQDIDTKFPAARRVSAPISPDVEDLRKQFEVAFPTHRLASHADELYAIPLDHFDVKFANAAQAAHFALPPLATMPLSARGLEWRNEHDQPCSADKVNIDLDVYAQELTEAIELVLTPQTYIRVRRSGATQDPFKLIGVKRRVAAALAERAAAIYDAPDPSRAVAVLADLLLEDLRTAYRVSTVVDFSTLPTTAKRPATFLFGDVVFSGEDAARCKAPNALIELAEGKALTVALTVTDPAMSKVVKTSIRFDVTHVGVADTPGDARPTRWYRLEGAPQQRMVTSSPVEIPVPLRRMAVPPALAKQGWEATPLPTDVAQQLASGPFYDYTVQFDTIPVAQDRLHLDVEYQLPVRARALDERESLVRALAAFHETYAAVKPSLASSQPDAVAVSVLVAAAEKVADALVAPASFAALRARSTSDDSQQESYTVDADRRVQRTSGSVCAAYSSTTADGHPPAPAPWRRQELKLQKIDATKHDSARAGIRLTRNESLIENRTVNAAFVYSTERSQFPNPVAPYIERLEALDVSAISGAKPLNRHLLAILSGLTSTHRLVEVRITLDFAFEGSAGGKGHPARSPMHLVTARAIDQGTIEQFSSTLAGEIAATLHELEPPQEAALRVAVRLHTADGQRAFLYWDQLMIPLASISDRTWE